MKQGQGLILWLGLLLAVPVPARAFVLITEEIDGQLRPVRWPSGALTIPYVLNDRPLELLPNLARSSTPVAAVEAALETWSIGPVRLYLDGMVSQAGLAADGRNLITFADTPGNRDYTGGAWARTRIYAERRGDQVVITETDLVLNPRMPFATDGRPSARDLQDILTHELGHALGLTHTPVAATTMYPFSGPGPGRRRLERDDLAAFSTLYGGPPTEPVSTVTGQVLARDGRPILGAHVTATDAVGIAQIGAMTDRDGRFAIPSLPPGDYQFFAEPLDGPMLPIDVSGFYRGAVRDFRTAFAGGNLTPATVTVTAGQTAAVPRIEVERGRAALNPQYVTLTSRADTFQGAANRALQIRPGQSAFLAIVGAGLNSVPRSGFSISGDDITLDTTRVARGTTTSGLTYAVFPISARQVAPPGARSLYVTSSSERATFTGCVEVVP